VDELRFRSQTEKHELSHLYEAKIKNMGNAGRNGGEYYTPRPLDPAYLSYVLRSPAFLEAAIGGLDREVLLDLLALLSAEGRVGEDDEAPNIVHTNTLGENQMISKDFQRRVREGAGQATLPIINKSKWSALTVLVPQAPEDQNRIVEELDTLQANLMSLEDVYQRKLADLEELKQSLLHQAFSGQL
jgi:hypothetical protein